MIFACPLLLLKYCANILLDRELGPIPVYTLRRCLPSSRAFKMHLCAFYSPVFGDWSCTWYSYWVMVLYKNRKIFFSFDFILQIAHSQSFYFIFFCVCAYSNILAMSLWGKHGLVLRSFFWYYRVHYILCGFEIFIPEACYFKHIVTEVYLLIFCRFKWILKINLQ